MGILIVPGILFVCFMVWRAVSNFIDKKAQRISDDLFRRKMWEIESRENAAKKEIEVREKVFKKEIDSKNAEIRQRQEILLELRNAFEQDFVTGRKWLANFIAEAYKTYDDHIVNFLKNKRNPAYAAAEVVKEVKAEKREAVKQIKYLQYQIETFKEYFPILAEYEEVILNERIDFVTKDSSIEDTDRVMLYVSKEEYGKLSISQRNQLALDRYLKKNKSNWEVGRMYERFLGQQYESEKWSVQYVGALKGFEDMGRDLICEKEGKKIIIQAKYWAADKTIHEKHIFQLYGTVLCYEIENDLPARSVTPVFVTSAKLSEVSKKAAERLGIEVKIKKFDSGYPMIKCNISNNNEKIYHLPFDQQYDRVKISKDGEFYALTVEEAELKGFRRAMRYFSS